MLLQKLCLTSGWLMTRSLLTSIQCLGKNSTDLHNMLLAVNAVTFGVHAIDAFLEFPAESLGLYLYGLTILGGSPASAAAMFLFQHKSKTPRFELKFLAICGIQCLLLMSFVQFRDPGYTMSLQLNHAQDELSFAVRSFFEALFGRLRDNTRMFFFEKSTLLDVFYPRW